MRFALTCIFCLMASQGAERSDPASAAPAAATCAGTARVDFSASYVAMNTPVPGTEPRVSMTKPR